MSSSVSEGDIRQEDSTDGSPATDRRTEDDTPSETLERVLEAADEEIPEEVTEMMAGDIEQAPYHVVAMTIIAAAQAGPNASTKDIDPEKLEQLTEGDVEGTPGIEELIEARTDAA